MNTEIRKKAKNDFEIDFFRQWEMQQIKDISNLLSIIELSQIVMYEFLYDYVKTKYKKTRTMLCGH